MWVNTFNFFFWPHHVACGILVLWPGIEPTSPALQGKFLITGPPGKSSKIFKKYFLVTNSTPLHSYFKRSREWKVKVSFYFCCHTSKHVSFRPSRGLYLLVRFLHLSFSICDHTLFLQLSAYMQCVCIQYVCPRGVASFSLPPWTLQYDYTQNQM